MPFLWLYRFCLLTKPPERFLGPSPLIHLVHFLRLDRGILFRSDLPGVPSSIRFYGFGSKGILAQIQELRLRHLAQKKTG